MGDDEVRDLGFGREVGACGVVWRELGCVAGCWGSDIKRREFRSDC